MKKSVCLLIVLLLLCGAMLTLVACNIATVTMSFEVGTDATPIEPIQAKVGSRISPPSDPEHKDLIFEGWYLDPEFTGRAVKIPNKMPKKDMTYYAHFIPAVSAVYEVLPDESGDLDARVDSTVSSISNMLKLNGYAKSSVSKSIGEDNKIKITVEMYLKNNAEVYPAKRLLEAIGKSASVLEFKGEDSADAENLITGREHLKSANVMQDDNNAICLKFNDVGKKKFADITSEYLGNRIYIFVDGELYTQVIVNAQVTDGTAIILNAAPEVYDYSYALEFATKLQAGTFRVDLRLVQMTNITN